MMNRTAGRRLRRGVEGFEVSRPRGDSPPLIKLLAFTVGCFWFMLVANRTRGGSEGKPPGPLHGGDYSEPWVLKARVAFGDQAVRFPHFSIKMLKKIKERLNSLKKRITWWKIFVLIILPLILATPWPPFKYIASLSKQEGNVQKDIEIPTEIEALGTSLFSKILGIETTKLPILLCLWNGSEFYIAQQNMVSEEIPNSEEIGLISLDIIYPDNQMPEKLSARRHTTNCSNLEINRSSNIFLKKEATIKDIRFESSDIPQELLQKVRGLYPEVKVMAIIFSIPDFFSKPFFKNYFISFIASSFLIIHLLKDIKEWIFKDRQ
ncbi:MAG: hypothetical protein AAB518_02710 [Patescibacteria group bacterium]